jgi:EAL domain-containing protein (putative c-di-GMP-specific phosphodiesterase class I)
MTQTVAHAGRVPDHAGPERHPDEWFTEGSAFDTLSQLADALSAMASDDPSSIPSALRLGPGAGVKLLPRVPASEDVDVLESFRPLEEMLESGGVMALRRRRTRERLRAAIEEGAVSSLYQPIVDLRTGHVAGVEALARFDDGSPMRWFREASRVGLREVLETAAIREALSGVPALPRDTYISLNISPGTLSLSAVRSLLSVPSLDRVVIEMTEDAIAEDYERLTRALQPLREAGVRVAVDDAGAGVTSLRHFILFHPDVIKIDTSLIRGIEHGPARRALSGALVALARETRATVVAEGIETAAELHALRELGVTHGQGFLLAPPLSLPLDLEAIVAAALEQSAA